jgi:cold shock CspA family protein
MIKQQRMAKSKITFNKREKERQRQKEKLEKKEKMDERRANQVKGKSLEDMMAYIDENGNISSTPPDPRKKITIEAKDIPLGVPSFAEQEQALREGRIDYFNEPKGFGFIIDKSGEKFFFHVSQLLEPVRENDRVNFETERGPKGWTAVGVKKSQ